VRDARRKRREPVGASTDWIVVRNRLSMFESPTRQFVAGDLKELSLRLAYCDHDCYVEHCSGTILALENHAKAS
jgi:hypothetical protein